MNQHHDFNAGRDHELGDLVRAHLSAPDSTAFAARVLDRLPLGGGSTAWEIIAGWARPGLAAALLLATLTGFWMATRASATTSVEVLAVEGLDGGRTVGGDDLLAAVLAGGR